MSEKKEFTNDYDRKSEIEDDIDVDSVIEHKYDEMLGETNHEEFPPPNYNNCKQEFIEA